MQWDLNNGILLLHTAVMGQEDVSEMENSVGFDQTAHLGLVCSGFPQTYLSQYMHLQFCK